jgi:hypothetical protein
MSDKQYGKRFPVTLTPKAENPVHAPPQELSQRLTQLGQRKRTVGLLEALGDPTTGILFSGDLPTAWTQYLNFTASGNEPFLKHPSVELQADGDVIFEGIVFAEKIIAEEIQTTVGDVTSLGGEYRFLQADGFFDINGQTATTITAISTGSVVVRDDAGGGTGISIGVRLLQSTESGGADITDAYGLKVEDHNVSGANNFAIHTSDGEVSLGDTLKIRGLHGIVCANAALATTATDGFLYVPTCAGPPTGTPTTQTGTVALVFDTTNNDLYVYDGSWISVGLA